MKAPEKLYIALDELTEDGRTFVLDHRIDYPICTEYTRTDAFIEKACEWLLINASDYCILHNSYDTKELVKDFVDAMKRD